MSKLGDKLRENRVTAIAKGQVLLTEEEVLAEVRARRSGDMEPTIDEMNRYVSGKLNIPWHERVSPIMDYPIICSCGEKFSTSDFDDHYDSENPDFSTDEGAVRLLREMMKQEDYYGFLVHIGLGTQEFSLEDAADVMNIITTPVALLKAAFTWFKEQEE